MPPLDEGIDLDNMSTMLDECEEELRLAIDHESAAGARPVDPLRDVKMCEFLRFLSTQGQCGLFKDHSNLVGKGAVDPQVMVRRTITRAVPSHVHCKSAPCGLTKRLPGHSSQLDGYEDLAVKTLEQAHAALKCLLQSMDVELRTDHDHHHFMTQREIRSARELLEALRCIVLAPGTNPAIKLLAGYPGLLAYNFDSIQEKNQLPGIGRPLNQQALLLMCFGFDR